MKLTKTVLILCSLLCLHVRPADAAPTYTIKGVVITPDGTVVPDFSVVVRHVTDKPELVQRKHFKNGEFTISGLQASKYHLLLSAPQFIRTKLIVDFKSEARDTDYSIIILHPYRNEVRLAPGAAYSVSVKVLQQKIPDAARQAYLKGVELHRDGKLEEALIEYGKALRNYPGYIEALSDIGTILLLYNRPEGALTFLRRAQEIDDSNVIINLNIAVALTDQGDYAGALKLLKNVLQTQPRMALAEFFVAKISYIQKKYDEAKAHLQQALENDPTLLDGWVLMINLSLQEKNYDEAREGLQRIRDVMKNQVVAKFIDEQLSTLGG
jgi:tetratricopeptide (TPR) repeat protein